MTTIQAPFQIVLENIRRARVAYRWMAWLKCHKSVQWKRIPIGRGRTFRPCVLKVRIFSLLPKIDFSWIGEISKRDGLV